MTEPGAPQDPQYGPPQYGQQYGQPQPGQGGYGPPPGGPGGYGGGGQPPPNYLVWAILSTLCCCLPLGIASIVFAAQVNTKWQAGDVAGAQESSRKARLFAILALAIGLPVNIVVIAIQIAAGDLSTAP